MGELIGWLFWPLAQLVGKPQRVIAIAVLIGVCALLGQTSPWKHTRRFVLLWIPAAAWGLYGAWEAMLKVTDPGAYIRIDLFLIWPVVFLVTLVFAVRALRRVVPVEVPRVRSARRPVVSGDQPLPERKSP